MAEGPTVPLPVNGEERVRFCFAYGDAFEGDHDKALLSAVGYLQLWRLYREARLIDRDGKYYPNADAPE